jgi:hypothetical protein
MATDANQGSRELREALERYLRERPDAADTLVGIAEWWLPSSLQGVALERLRNALAELVAANEMRCTVLPDGSELYARAPAAGPVTPIEPDES